MIVPNPFYRINAARAVLIHGAINSDLVSRLTPQILRLQAESREPITVLIDSPGGSAASMEAVNRLLRLSDQDASDPCHIITVATNQAASAAADLLSAGDYAIAYPTSSILYHGVRREPDRPLTEEFTTFWGWFLRISNDRYAMELALKIEERFSFRFLTNRGEFPRIRTEAGNPNMTDLECFVQFIDTRLSEEGKKLWKKTRERHARYKDLFDSVLKKQKKGKGKKASTAEEEGARLKAIIAFEVKANRASPNWSFRFGGIASLADDFFLLDEYLSSAGHARLRQWSMQFGRFVLPKDVIDEITLIPDEQQRTEKLVEKVQPNIEPLWSFFVALCHALQSGENELTALDAYWLGLVDEVVGAKLLSLRTLIEFQPDNPPEPAAGQAAEPAGAPPAPPAGAAVDAPARNEADQQGAPEA